ncbi:hypothetical protein [Mycolicibacterium palauense]|uniref:hypothetical protein n=1 Tax=Mycolicibacterium palauense TaxID=2034511 RepID=UPI000BFEAF2D|nr:hypothetical protein [Mycolicibacterium palauense]
MSYTIAELDEAIENDEAPWGGSWHEFEYMSTGVGVPGIGTAKVLESKGGGEGSGEERWFVFSVENADGTRIFKRHGWYASFVGSSFDGPTVEVKPVQKTITVWEKL